MGSLDAQMTQCPCPKLGQGARRLHHITRAVNIRKKCKDWALDNYNGYTPSGSFKSLPQEGGMSLIFFRQGNSQIVWQLSTNCQLHPSVWGVSPSLLKGSCTVYNNIHCIPLTPLLFSCPHLVHQANVSPAFKIHQNLTTFHDLLYHAGPHQRHPLPSLLLGPPTLQLE